MRKLYTQNKCYTCKKVMVQPKTGRTRKYCNDACKQRYYRMKRRQEEGRQKRGRRRRIVPLYERKFTPYTHKAPHLKMELSATTAVYLCEMCNEHFIRDRSRGGAVSKFCSDACRERAKQKWNKLIDAYYLSESIGRRSGVVWERMGDGLLSPICPQCGIAFAPSTKTGRKRVYCTDHCRKAAYEDRYKQSKGRKRKHRYADCPNCGKHFDRLTIDGKLQREFCSVNCGLAYRARRKYRREAKIHLRKPWTYKGMQARDSDGDAH